MVIFTVFGRLNGKGFEGDEIKRKNREIFQNLPKTLQTSPIQFFSSPKLEGFCIMKKTKTPQRPPLSYLSILSTFSFLFLETLPYPSKLPNRALV